MAPRIASPEWIRQSLDEIASRGLLRITSNRFATYAINSIGLIAGAGLLWLGTTWLPAQNLRMELFPFARFSYVSGPRLIGALLFVGSLIRFAGFSLTWTLQLALFGLLAGLHFLPDNFLPSPMRWPALNPGLLTAVPLIALATHPGIKKALNKYYDAYFVSLVSLGTLWPFVTKAFHIRYLALSFSPMVPYLRPVTQVFAEMRAGILSAPGGLRQIWALLFSPIHLITPVPISSSEFQFDPQPLVRRLIGLLNIAIGFLMLWIAYEFRTRVNFYEIHPENLLVNLWNGWLKYLFYYLLSCASLILPIGCGQWLDIKLTNPFRYPLIATNPLDRWRDWNTYFQRWFFQFGFVPTFRKTKSLLLATMAAFLLSFLTHENLRLLSPLLSPGSLQALTTKAHFIFFMLHGGAVFLAFKTRAFWGEASRLRGWLGVLATHVIMAAIHYFAP